MDKQEAQQELAKLIKRQAELQAIIDAKPVSLLTPGNEYFFEDVFVHAGFARFKERNAYADAFDTMLMLRHQPGSEAPNRGWQCHITTRDGEVWVHPCCLRVEGSKLSQISPCFASEADAQAAIDTVGADRILRMFRALHGVQA